MAGVGPLLHGGRTISLFLSLAVSVNRGVCELFDKLPSTPCLRVADVVGRGGTGVLLEAGARRRLPLPRVTGARHSAPYQRVS